MGEPRDWTDTRILVTGATGFIGKHLVNQLRDRGALIYAGTSPTTESHCSPHTLTFDVRDAEAVHAAVDQADPDVVFHLAAVGVTNPAIDPLEALRINAGGTVNLLEALRGRNVQRVVLVGTSHEYGARQTRERLDPYSPYAASKVASWAYGRMYWRAYGLPTVTVRPFQVYGPGQPEKALIPSAIKAALSGEDFPMTTGEQELDFVYAEDVIAGMVAAAGAPDIAGHSFDIGTGAGHTVRSVVDQIWQLTDAVGDVLAGTLPSRPGEPTRLVADAERTARLTGWRAHTSLKEGLCRTIQSLGRGGRQLDD